MTLSRRDFLKVGGSACLVASSAALVGAGATAAFADEEAIIPGAQPVNFAQEADVLIIGTGFGGLAAAMEPIKAGKSVILAEKKPVAGGDSLGSCCFMFASGTELQINAGYPTTIDEYWEASKEKLAAGYDYDWYEEWVKGKTYANTKFVDVATNEFGCAFQEPCTEEELPRLSGSVILPAEGIASGGKYIIAPLCENLEAKGAQFMYNQCATNLITSPEGAIIGARFENTDTGEITDIKATSVVLATGGFADNGEMMLKYLPDWAGYGQLVHGCMGEGHKMGAAAGGALMGMDTSYTFCNLMGDIPNCTTWGYWAPAVLVLPNGKRFIQEAQSHDAAQVAVDNGYREWWSIFDQRAFDARAIAASVESNIKSHADAYVTAETLEDLAVAMDVPVDTLVETFARYDELVAGGEDTDFGKTAWLESLQPPYHALRLNVCRYKTSGGFMVGPNNQVLDANGEEIPGLYAAGAVCLQSSASASACLATGYYVGESIAAL